MALVRSIYEHYNSSESLPLDQRRSSPIKQVRDFNNWLKAVLIGKSMAEVRMSFPDETCHIKVLDLACGKGGDIRKWARHNVEHVFFADLTDQSIEECRRRYEDNRKRSYRYGFFNAMFIVADCATEAIFERVLSTIGRSVSPFEFHLSSCQFSLHYSFETPQRADQFFRNAVEHLKPGGYFIATIPNANRIMKRLRDSDTLEFGNDAYGIKFPENFDKWETPPLFGCSYDFFLSDVVNCPEFLVYWPLLEYIAKRHGMELVFNMDFDVFLEKYHLDDEGRFLLQTMGGLVTVYPSPDKASDMDHIVRYIKSLSAETRDSLWSIGTLSKSQWDVVTLYLAFAFKKKE